MASFDDFLACFETVEPPFTITEETVGLLEKNEPIPEIFVDEFLSQWELEHDEFSEYVAILKLPAQKEYEAIIYWKASLLKYEYILVTSKDGNLVSRKIISAKIIEGDIIKSSAARIDHDLIIYIMAGVAFDIDHYDPTLSQQFSMEIMENGEIIFTVDDE